AAMHDDDRGERPRPLGQEELGSSAAAGLPDIVAAEGKARLPRARRAARAAGGKAEEDGSEEDDPGGRAALRMDALCPTGTSAPHALPLLSSRSAAQPLYGSPNPSVPVAAQEGF